MILLTPGPSMVSQRVMRAMQEPMLFHRSEPFKELLSEVEGLLQRLFITREQVCLLTGSGTLAVESMVHSLVEPGDEVLVLENGEFGRRVVESLAARRARTRVLSAPEGGAVSSEAAMSALDLHEYSSLFLVYTETSTGVTNRDLEGICRGANAKGVLTCIDAISAIGGEPLNVSELGADAVAGCSQKCVGAPPGLSFVALSKAGFDRARSTKERARYLDLGAYAEWLARNDVPFTPAVNLVRALKEALSEIAEAGGPQAKWRKQRDLAQLLYSASGDLGVDCFVVEERLRSNTIASFLPPRGMSVSDLVRGVWNEGYVIAPGMGELKEALFRVGIMGAVGEREIRGYADALSKVTRAGT